MPCQGSDLLSKPRAGTLPACAARHAGNPARLAYGTDSFGLTCGVVNHVGNRTLDLSRFKNKYWLNPLDLLSGPTDAYYAKAICMRECPSTFYNVHELPPDQPLCTSDLCFR